MAATYLDSHFGFGDTDITSSDLELAIGTPASTTLKSLNVESGAGYYGHVTLTDSGTVVVGHLVKGSNQFLDDDDRPYVVEKGIYAEVVTAEGVLNSSVLLPGVETASRVATGSFNGTHHVAVHQRGTESLFLFSSSDDGVTWRPSPVEQRGRTGRDPGMVFLDDGTMVLVYGHCRADTNQVLCDARNDGVRIAKRLSTGQFSRFDVRGDAEDLEGIGVDVFKSGPREVVAVHLNASQNTLLVYRLGVN